MKKRFDLVYLLCWCCLCWAVIAAIPHSPLAPFFSAANQPLWLKYLLLILVLLGMILLIRLTLSMTVTQSRKLQPAIKALAGAALFACGELVYGSFCDHSLVLGRALGGAMLLLFAWLGVILFQYSKTLAGKKNPIIWEVILLGAASVGLTLWVPGMWGLSLPRVTLPGDLLSHYIGQLSLTFITISVMSVLSDKSVIIYWENVAEAKLIRPLFGSFASFTGYSIAATVGAGISVILDCHLAFAVFFGANIVVLILLTLTMVDVYYGREQKKADRAKWLRRVAPVYQKGSAGEYRELMQNLQYHLHQQLEEHNIPFLREVAELYGGNIECFDSPEGQKIRQLLESAGVDITPMIADGLSQRLRRMEQDHAGIHALAGGAWREDHPLWAWLAREENLPLVVQNEAIRAKMLTLTLDRLTLLVNDILGNTVPLMVPAIRFYDPKQGYSALRLRRSQAYLRKFVQEQVLQDTNGLALIRDLTRTVQSLHATADPTLRRLLDHHLAQAVLQEPQTQAEKETPKA